jgi:hypothetical protein
MTALFVRNGNLEPWRGGSTTTTAPTIKSTPVPPTQVVPTTAPVTHSAPVLGGPISDFYGKYGTPHNQGSLPNSETWIASQQPVLAVNAAPDSSGRVTQVSVVGWDQNTGNSLSNADMLSYCQQFMPADATEFNTDANYIDYHSSIGEVVVLLQQGSDVMSLITNP